MLVARGGDMLLLVITIGIIVYGKAGVLSEVNMKNYAAGRTLLLFWEICA